MSSHEPVINSDYLYTAVCAKSLKDTIRSCANVLRGMEFDAIAFRGMSGALVAPGVAMELGKSLLMVRKPGDGTHSCCTLEGDINAKSYIILDDFISSGATVDAIIGKVHELCTNDPECLGVLSYHRLTNDRWKNSKPEFTTDTDIVVRRLEAPGVLHSEEEMCKLLD